MEKSEISKQFSESFDTIWDRIIKNIDHRSWNIYFLDQTTTKKNLRIGDIFGISDNFSGSTILSLVFDKARSVPFFIRVDEIKKNKCQVSIYVAGSENLIGTDWGRNKNLASLLLSFVTKKPEQDIVYEEFLDEINKDEKNNS